MAIKGIKERKIMVRVTKRIQEKDFEPFEIQLEESVIIDYPIDNPKKMRRKIYNRLKKELDSLIDKRWNELYPEDD